MNDRDIYRRVYLRLWRHPSFRLLTDGEKVLALYLVTGPQTNQIGCYYFSLGMASEDLAIPVPVLTQHLRVVCDAFGWQWRDDRLFYVPSWCVWNRPSSPNAYKSWRSEAYKVSDLALRQTLLDAIGTPNTRQAYDKGDDVATQDQEQKQELPPKPPAARGARSRPVSKVSKRELPKRGVTGPCPDCGAGDDGRCALIAECRRRQIALERAKVSA